MTESPHTAQDAETIGGFPARELVDAMKAEGLELHVGQTGGGTATCFLQQEGSHTFTIGPGTYSWNAPQESWFTATALYYGPDHYDDDGEPVEFSADEEKTITPGTPIADIAQEIAANFRRFNTCATDSTT
ncbi:hypothetical protein [Paenarthrobacter ilicis]|uniref:hypothetical protein n=1 Tax=Paenarthrobacter ilicis TaxID=43665 RepID=UPI00386F8519